MCHCGNLINTWNITNISPTRGMKPNLNFLKLKGVDIFQQLIVEEFLMRKCSKNWYIFNHGIKIPQIVLGFSGKVKELVDTNLVKLDNIPLIKRFTGGGTVIVDKSTIFGTFIMNESDADTPPYPREIMKWSTEFYANSFKIKNQDLTLNEHDYCIGDLKIGGNAQAIIKSRWCHHTSFLWDYDIKNMQYLLMPKKRPEYRRDREHESFLDKIKNHVSSVDVLEEDVRQYLSKLYVVKDTKMDDNLMIDPSTTSARDILLSLGYPDSELVFDRPLIRTKYITTDDER